jgi:hypothetical protein
LQVVNESKARRLKRAPVCFEGRFLQEIAPESGTVTLWS